jgi:hypothetical protein
MSAEIIKVLDYLCAKLGIVIDWTAENVWPQVLDFIGRYQMFAIIKNCIWIGFSILAIIISAILIGHAWKNINNKDSAWYDTDVSGVAQVVTVIAAIMSGIFIIVVMCNIFAAVEWAAVPEVKFFEILSYHMN